MKLKAAGRIVSSMMAVVLAIGLMPLPAFAAPTTQLTTSGMALTTQADAISYVDAKGNPRTANSCTELTSGKLTKAWYYVQSSSKWIDNIWIPSDAVDVVNIILCDGANLGTYGISLANGKTLRIWAQSVVAPRGNKDRDYHAYNDTSVKVGRLHTSKYGIRVHTNQTVEINGGVILADTSEDGQAGIGGKDGYGAGTITINGGDVRAYGTINAAGIGGGNGGKGGNITIAGGNVWARSDDEDGAGIGGGEGKGGGNITITGGDIVAYGSESAAGIGAGYDQDDGLNNTIINISDGKIYAKGGDRGAGIGCGEKGSRYAAKITISGGNIEARGGSRGAGIGGGDESGAGEIEISGGSVKAYGGDDAAGIGSGDNSDNEYGDDNKITITGGTVVAEGGERGAGIGGGEDSPHGGTITIEGSWKTGQFATATNGKWSDPVYTTNVVAKGGERGAGIGGGDEGGGGTITINGGRVKATGGKYAAGIGSGDNSDSGHTGGTINITGYPVLKYNADGSVMLDQDGKPVVWTDDFKHPVYSSYVTANGGEDGAGIGGGDYSESGNITINGACVEAKGARRGAGIGGSCNAKANTITIKNNAYVQATGDYGAGIGTGAGELMKNPGTAMGEEFPTRIVGGTINIENGNVIAVSTFGGAGIGGGIFGRADTINISGGQVAAQGGVTAGPGSVPWLYIAQVGGAAIIGMGGNLAGQIANTSAGSGSPIGENASGLFESLGMIFSAAWNWLVNLFADEPDMVFYTGAGIGGGFCASGGTINISDNAVVQATAGILPPNWCLEAQVDASGADVDYEDPDREHPARAIGEGGGVVVYKAGDPSTYNATVAAGKYVQNVNIGDGYQPTPAVVATVDVELDAKLVGKEFEYTANKSEPITFLAKMPDGSTPGTDSAQVHPVAVIQPLPLPNVSVTYDANADEGISGEMELQTTKAGTTINLTKNTFKRENYYFTGWNTKADGTGTAYADEGKLLAASNITLYAQWHHNPIISFYSTSSSGWSAQDYAEYGSNYRFQMLPKDLFGPQYDGCGWVDMESGRIFLPDDQPWVIYDVTKDNYDLVMYDPNPNTGKTLDITYKANGGNGEDKTDSLNTSSSNWRDYTVLDANTFSRTGYTLTKWRRTSDIQYTPGSDKPYATTSSPHSFWLLAQWTPITYTVQFDANGGAGSIADQQLTYDAEKALSDINGENGEPQITRAGYRFTGWNTEKDGSGTAYSNRESVMNLTDTAGKSITLYAQWKAKTYTVSFYGNGGDAPGATEEDEPVHVYSQSFEYNTPFELEQNQFVRDGYEFTGWNTYADPATATGESPAVAYANKKEVTLTNDLALYAQWEKLPSVNYTVKFDANGGEGTMADQLIQTDVDKELAENTFTRTGYSFMGWNTVAEPTEQDPGVAYKNRTSVKDIPAKDGDVIQLYAQWRPITYFVEFASDPTFEASVEGLMEGQYFTYDEEQALLKNNFTREGYEFIGWNTKEDGSGTMYSDEQVVKNITTVDNDYIVLWAQWKHVHGWGEWVVTKEPTCTDKGEETRTCKYDKTHTETREIAALGHDWDAWKVTKKPTALNKGTKKRACKNDPNHVEKKSIEATGVKGALLAEISFGDDTLELTWTKVEGAEGYDIFFAPCSTKTKENVSKKVETVKGNATFSWTKSGLKKGTAYKAYVKAWAKKGSKKTYVKKSPTVHGFAGGYTKTRTNAKSVSVKKAKVSIAAGKTFKIKATVAKLKNSKKLISKKHAPNLRYISSNPKVAKVNSSGKVTAKSKGTCKVFAFAANGVKAVVKITVK